MPYQKTQKYPINGLAEYCCNDPVSNGSEVTCNSASGSPFFVPDATLVAGYAALANVSSLSASTSASNSTSSSSSSSSNSRDVAIGAGVGVPLGVIALGAIAWALWERRARTKGLAAAAAAASGGGSVRAGSWAGGYGAVATSVAGSNSQYGIQQYETGQWKNAARPAELTTSARTHELAS
ncbi:unnamed protein product [Aspergillus oryzae]|nr:unnamed protein product [Aspergillus oryzae]GMF90850.1 unnamed protein product [Aspergillus oryzae]